MTANRRFWTGLALAGAAACTLTLLMGDFGGRLSLAPPEGPDGDSLRPPGHGFPRTVADDLGHRVTVRAPPCRIVSNSVVADGFLFAIVEPDRILAASRFSFDLRYSQVAEQVRRLGLPTSESPEVAVSLRPDLVFSGTHADPAWTDLVARSGVPVYSVGKNATTLVELVEMIRRVGYLTGCDQRAEEVVLDFRRRLERAVARRPPDATGRPRLLGYSRPVSYSYGSQTLFHDVVTRLGGINVGAEQGLEAYDGISSEDIAAWNPDWIVTGADPGAQEDLMRSLMQDPGVATTVAAKRGQVLILPNPVFLSVNHNIIGLVEALAAALYPEEV